MRAISQRSLGGPEVLEIVEVDTPVPGPGQALVKVHAAGVNPADWKIRSGLVRRFGEPPFTLGLDLSGVIEAVGEAAGDAAGEPVGDAAAGDAASPFVPGQHVYASARQMPGAYAEYTAVPVTTLAAKPPSLDDVHAAALPTAALTAWQALRAGGLRAGQRVLIHAASGGVGHLAVQIAKAHGAYVIGTARADKHSFLRDLGADELIDYTTTDFATAAKDVDLVLDPISGDYGPRSLDTLAPGGTLVDVRGTGPDRTAVREQAATRGVRLVEFGYTPSGTDLDQITALVEDGSLRVAVERVLPLRDAALAHHLSETNRVRGKIVLVP